MTKAVQSGKKILNFKEAALLTGYTENYLYKLTRLKKIPFYKPNGGALRFDAQELEAWLLSNRKKPRHAEA